MKKPCPSCGCYRFSYARGEPERDWCVIALDGGGIGLCVPAGELPGHDTCSGCLPGTQRLPAGAWYAPDDEAVAELQRLGLLDEKTPWLALRAQVPAPARPADPDAVTFAQYAEASRAAAARRREEQLQRAAVRKREAESRELFRRWHRAGGPPEAATSARTVKRGSEPPTPSPAQRRAERTDGRSGPGRGGGPEL